MYKYIILGNIIRQHRIKHNFTLEELAELCEVSARCISNIERGLSDPKISTIIKIYHVLNEDIGELIHVNMKRD